MNLIELNAIFRLRRDNDYNYAKVENKFIPANGEVCLVDTARNGLRAKIGDGISTFASLPFADTDIASNIIVRGYIYENQFYSDANFTYVIEPSVNKIYIDALRGTVYYYHEGKYIAITQTVPAASEV